MSKQLSFSEFLKLKGWKECDRDCDDGEIRQVFSNSKKKNYTIDFMIQEEEAEELLEEMDNDPEGNVPEIIKRFN